MRMPASIEELRPTPVAARRLRLRRLWVRRVWVLTHLWLGVTLGVIGALVGVTGSVLVFDRAIDGVQNPQRYATSGKEIALPYAEYAQRGARVVGDGARVVNLRIPHEGETPVVVFVRASANGSEGGAAGPLRLGGDVSGLRAVVDPDDEPRRVPGLRAVDTDDVPRGVT